MTPPSGLVAVLLKICVDPTVLERGDARAVTPSLAFKSGTVGFPAAAKTDKVTVFEVTDPGTPVFVL